MGHATNLNLDGLGLTLEKLDKIQGRGHLMFGKIKYRAEKQLHFARNVGKMLYGSLAKVNNMTSDSLCLYLNLYSVTREMAQQTLVPHLAIHRGQFLKVWPGN